MLGGRGLAVKIQTLTDPAGGRASESIQTNSEHLEQLNIKHQGAVRRDTAGSALTIGQL